MDDDLDDEPVWLYRAVPDTANEVFDVDELHEVVPPRPDRVGERWRHEHSMLDFTQTAYTSWSGTRSIAADLGQLHRPGAVVVFKVRRDSVDPAKLFRGREDEDEYLIEGTVVDVEISHEDEEDEGEG